MIGDLLLRLPGASAYFPGAVVTYSRQSRIDLLGVPAEVVVDHGTVSEETVKTMATGVRERFRADLGLASSGVAGPTGGSPGRPVGLVWLAAGRGGWHNGHAVRIIRQGPCGHPMGLHLDGVTVASGAIGEMTETPNALHVQLAAVLQDRTHGAAFLAQRAVWALGQAAADEAATQESVKQAAAVLRTARPEMAAVANAVSLLLERLESGGWALSKAPSLASQLIAEVQGWAEQAAERAADLIPEGARVLSCSYSSTVVRALTVARDSGTPFTALVLPSAGYGLAMIEELRHAKVDAEPANTLPRDSAAGDTLGIIGADSVYPGSNVVNGSPSLGLAQWCKDRSLPFYVVCDSLKFVRGTTRERPGLPPAMDRVPVRMITGIVTEPGLLQASKPVTT